MSKYPIQEEEPVVVYPVYQWDCPQCGGAYVLGDVEPYIGEILDCDDCKMSFRVEL